ncbi:MAG TPA: hypothetical protein PLQ54_11640 [Armatimonadota bacterium]|nr:hypothetical protein [Armatimonadota bacterium]
MRHRATWGLSAVVLLTVAMLPAGTEDGATIDVRSLGAIGDGQADDTDAFARALALGREQHKPVMVSVGQYRLTRAIRLEEQCLTGVACGGWPADSMPMPVLRIDHTDSPGVVLDAHASLLDLAILYPEGTQFPEEGGPPAVSLEGQGPTISRVRIQYPYDGIMTAPGAFPGRARLSDIFIVSPKRDGVYLTKSLDVSQLRNIEVWCNVGLSTGAGFRFGRNDDCQCSDLFAFQCQVGFEFDPDEDPGPGGGTFYGSLTNCSTDACSLGYVVRGNHRLNVANSDLVDHHASLDVDGEQASVRLTGCWIQTNGAPAIRVTRAANVSVANSLFTRAFAADFPYVEAAACGSLIVTGCQFRPLSRGIELGEGVQRAVVVHNVFESDQPAIVDRMGPDAKRILEPNVEG